MSSGDVLPNHAENTKVLAFHLYVEDWKAFMGICRKKRLFHSEILRKLVHGFIENNKEKTSSDDSEIFDNPISEYLGKLAPPLVEDDLEKEDKNVKVVY